MNQREEQDMDPVENMREQRELASIIGCHCATGDHDNAEVGEAAERLAELVEALHDWRIAGGFDPYTAPFEGVRRF